MNYMKLLIKKLACFFFNIRAQKGGPGVVLSLDCEDLDRFLELSTSLSSR